MQLERNVGIFRRVATMAFGYNPFLASWSPYHGAAYAVVDAAAKVVAAGARCSIRCAIPIRSISSA